MEKYSKRPFISFFNRKDLLTKYRLGRDTQYRSDLAII